LLIFYIKQPSSGRVLVFDICIWREQYGSVVFFLAVAVSVADADISCLNEYWVSVPGLKNVAD
jgi:hypothetical protein